MNNLNQPLNRVQNRKIRRQHLIQISAFSLIGVLIIGVLGFSAFADTHKQVLPNHYASHNVPTKTSFHKTNNYQVPTGNYSQKTSTSTHQQTNQSSQVAASFSHQKQVHQTNYSKSATQQVLNDTFHKAGLDVSEPNLFDFSNYFVSTNSNAYQQLIDWINSEHKNSNISAVDASVNDLSINGDQASFTVVYNFSQTHRDNQHIQVFQWKATLSGDKDSPLIKTLTSNNHPVKDYDCYQ